MSRLQVVPQEIADHIIDQVVESDKAWKPTLCACSIVSKAFHPQARRHLFSHIEFLADDSANKRAGRLLKVIASDTNRHLLTSIHSITLLLEIHSGYDQLRHNPSDLIVPSFRSKLDDIYRRIKEVRRKMARKIELRNNYMVQLFELFIRLPIRRLVLHGRSHSRTRWNEFCRSHYGADFAGFLSQIACNPAFTTLSFKGIMNPTLSFSAEPVFRELLLDDIAGFEFEIAQDQDIPCLINVRNLQITNSSPLFIPFSLLSSYFPHLTALVVSVPRHRYEMPIVRFILPVLLRALKSITWTIEDPGGDLWGSHYLNHFTALRHFKFKAWCQPLDYLHDMLAGLVGFLASATSPIPLGSITIDLFIDWRSRAAPMLWDRTPFSSSGDEKWKALDAALSSPVFVHLSQVTLAFRLFDDEPWMPVPAAQDIQSYLPTLYSSLAIKFEAIVETDTFSNWNRPPHPIVYF